MITKEMLHYLHSKLHLLYDCIDGKSEDGKVTMRRVEEKFIPIWDEIADLYVALGGEYEDLE